MDGWPHMLLVGSFRRIGVNLNMAEPPQGTEKPWPWTVAEFYECYRSRGGNRNLDPRILEDLGPLVAAEIDRDFLFDWASGWYLSFTTAEIVENIVEPVAEILGLPPPDDKYDFDYIDNVLGPLVFDRGGGDWASITRPATGPPRAPGPRARNHYLLAGSSHDYWMYRHRGQTSKSRADDGTMRYFGDRPSKGSIPVYERLPNGRLLSIGYVLGKRGRPRKPKPKKAPAKIGRPRKYGSAAERLKAWRRRNKHPR
jgi:hypothetical protein